MIERFRGIGRALALVRMLAECSPRPGIAQVWLAAFVTCVATVVAAPTPVHAQLDTLINPLGAIQAEAASWVGEAQSVATYLFRILLVLELTFFGFQLALFRDNLADFFGGITIKILTAGFFYWLIQDGPSLFQAIINSFTGVASQMDSQAGLSGLMTLLGEALGTFVAIAAAEAIGKTQEVAAAQVSAPFVLGTGVASMANGFPISNMQTLSIMEWVELLLILCIGVIVVQWILVNIESSIVMGAGLLFLGFAGSRWTMPFAQGYLSYALNVGVKLFTLYLILAVESKIGAQVFIAAASAAGVAGADITGVSGPAELAVLYYAAACAMIMAVLAWYVPNLAGSFLSGQSSMNASTVMSSMYGLYGSMQQSRANSMNAQAEGTRGAMIESQLQKAMSGAGGSGVMNGRGASDLTTGHATAAPNPTGSLLHDGAAPDGSSPGAGSVSADASSPAGAPPINPSQASPNNMYAAPPPPPAGRPSSFSGSGPAHGAPSVGGVAPANGAGHAPPPAPPLPVNPEQMTNPAFTQALPLSAGSATPPEELEAELEASQARQALSNAYAASSLRLPNADPVPSAIQVRMSNPDKL